MIERMVSTTVHGLKCAVCSAGPQQRIVQFTPKDLWPYTRNNVGFASRRSWDMEGVTEGNGNPIQYGDVVLCAGLSQKYGIPVRARALLKNMYALDTSGG